MATVPCRVSMLCSLVVREVKLVRYTPMKLEVGFLLEEKRWSGAA